MRKFIILIFCIILSTSASFATVQMKVASLEDFSTKNPKKDLNVSVLESITLGNYYISKGSKMNCEILQVIEPKRGKRNATFYVKPLSYKTNDIVNPITEEIFGRYSKTVLSVEELKKIPPSNILKQTVLLVGNHYIKGISIGVSFLEGAIKDDDNNRLKSGVVKAYENSPLSYISTGEQLEIKEGDEFYLIFKIEDDIIEPNYSYTIN